MTYMNEIMLTKRALDRLKHYELHDSILSTESELYYLKVYYDKPNLLLKKLFTPTDKIIEDKVRTIEEISSRKELQNIKELVVPKDLVVLGGQPIGLSIEEVSNSENLGVVLQNPNISMCKKIKLVSKVGKIVEKTTNFKKDFFFTDLHEYNFLVDDKDHIFAVDLDSSAVNSDRAIASKYLAVDRKLRRVNKYNVTPSGLAYPDKNSEIYCYNMIVLNLLTGERSQRIRIDDYYDYLMFLERSGVGDAILDPLSRMYTEQDNILIKDIKKNIPAKKDISYKAYKKTLIR